MRLDEINKTLTPGERALFEAAAKANLADKLDFLARIKEMATRRQFPPVVLSEYEGNLSLDEVRKIRACVDDANRCVLGIGSIWSCLKHNPDERLLEVMGDVKAARGVLGEDRTSSLAGHAQSFQAFLDVLERECKNLCGGYWRAAAQIPAEFHPAELRASVENN